MLASARYSCIPRGLGTPGRVADRGICRAVAGMEVAQLRQELADAIAVGAPLYNQGNPAGCYQVYHGTASRLAAALTANSPASVTLRSALETAAAARSPSDAAWAMRRAFDSILDGSVATSAPATVAGPVAVGVPVALGLPVAVGVPVAAAVSPLPAAAAAAAAVQPSPGVDTAQLRRELADAIAAGVPLYNQGNHAGCYQVYRSTATRLAATLTANSTAAVTLRRALETAAAARSPSDAAWAMRHSFDSIMDGSATAQVNPRPDPRVLPLLDFRGEMEGVGPSWKAMDDTIMGGSSSSSFTWNAAQRAAVFSGDVTTAFGGGFASVRTKPWAGWGQLASAVGVRLVVKGDGATYKLNLKMGTDYDGIFYQHDFTTDRSSSSSGWQTVDMRLADFKPNFRGRLVPNAKPLQAEKVRQVCIMISKFSDAGGLTEGFRPGSFRLLVQRIDALLR